jgi:hypothetical protein
MSAVKDTNAKVEPLVAAAASAMIQQEEDSRRRALPRPSEFKQLGRFLVYNCALLSTPQSRRL